VVADYTQIYQDAGNTFNVDPLLAQAVARVESGENPGLTSPKGAAGVMQVMPENLQRLNVIDPYKAEFNIPAGTRVLDEALTASGGNVPLGLRIYQGGTDQSKWGPQNAAYPARVAAEYQKLKAAQNASIPTTTIRASVPANDDIDDFLTGKSQPTTAPQPNQPSAQPDDIDRFLTGTSPPAASVAAPEEAARAPEPMAGVSEFGYSDPNQAPAATGDLAAAAGRVGQAAVEGFQQTPPLVTPYGQSLLNQGPLGRWLWDPLLSAVGVVPAAANALGGGVAQAITEGASAIGQPALGRDFNMLAQVAPFAHIGTGVPTEPGPMAVSSYAPTVERLAAEEAAARRPNIPPVDQNALQYPGFVPPGSVVPTIPTEIVRPSFLPPTAATDISGVSKPVIPPNGLNERVVPPGVQALDAAGAPGSVGAAGTPTTLSNMTPAEAAANRSVAEGQKLIETQPVGKDLNRYVPGVEPSTAEMEQQVATSRELKAIKMAAPEVSQEAKDVASRNNDLRQEYVESLVPSKVEIKNLSDERERQRVADTTAAWKNKAPADPLPIIEQAQAVLDGPDGRIGAVETAMTRLLDRITKPDGTYETDPQRIYGVRRDLANEYSKAAIAKEPTKGAAAEALKNVLPTVDQTIEKAAPGYGQYMENYARNSAQLDWMNALRDKVPDLYDTSGKMQLSRVYRLMKDVVESRASPGLNDFKHIPDDVMQGLWNLRDDLRRSATAEELARTSGSDTAQNALDLAKTAAKMGALGAAHAAAHAVAGVGGNVAVNRLSNVVGAINSVVGQRKLKTRGMNMLHPDVTKYPPPNPLTPP
jgi:hypothetical protein